MNKKILFTLPVISLLLSHPAKAEINWGAELALENSIERQRSELGSRSGSHLFNFVACL
jgi:hypothetical protein